MPLTDAELIDACRHGEEKPFADLVRRHQGYAYSIAFRLTASEDDAEDVVQEAFVRVWKNLSGFDPRNRFTTWLFTIVTNLALDRLRSLRRRRGWMEFLSDHQEDGFPDPADLAREHSNVELAGIVRSIASTLPEAQFLVFTLRTLEGLSVQEVSAITGQTPGSVKSNLYYAHKRIRETLKRRYHTEGTQA